MMVLARAARLSPSTVVRFAALVHDLGKGTTPPEMLPAHHGHEGRSVRLVIDLCERLKVPSAHRDLGRLVARHHGNVHRAFELRAQTVLKLLEECDALRRPERFADMLLACQADAQGRLGREDEPYPQRDYLLAAREAVAAVRLDESERRGLPGPAIAERLRTLRLAAAQSVREAMAPVRGGVAD
jgi:tRNA nucleotidyltransferase (CCA-adding enzyme)